MLSRVYSSTIIGIQGTIVEVEVDVSARGFPSISIVGLPHKSIEEAKDRIRAAIISTGYKMPECRITINLAPADIPKSGSGFDLPMALGLLAGSAVVSQVNIKDILVVGELALNGLVKPVRGILSTVQAALSKGISTIIVPADNAEEASLIPDARIIPVASLGALVDYCNGKRNIERYSRTAKPQHYVFENDFSFIQGQSQAKRALEIAASGLHNVHMKGPPGSGKTALSRAFSSILPPLSQEELIETCTIYSASGLSLQDLLNGFKPFRSPHHTTTRNGLIGGGNPPRAGEITLSHRGVLFLDELPEFPRSVIESLRQPLEDGEVSISRSGSSFKFPSRVLLITASNPCPCGYFGHPEKNCECTITSITNYQARLSGPFLDRIDIHLDVPPVKINFLLKNTQEESSSTIRERVLQGHERQAYRYRNEHYKINGDIPSHDIKKYIKLQPEDEKYIIMAIEKLQLSARAYFKMLRVCRTIADLDCCDNVSFHHIAEALQYSKRSLDK